MLCRASGFPWEIPSNYTQKWVSSSLIIQYTITTPYHEILSNTIPLPAKRENTFSRCMVFSNMTSRTAERKEALLRVCKSMCRHCILVLLLSHSSRTGSRGTRVYPTSRVSKKCGRPAKGNPLISFLDLFISLQPRYGTARILIRPFYQPNIAVKPHPARV